MATVTGKTSDTIDGLFPEVVVDGRIVAGILYFTDRSGAEFVVGPVGGGGGGGGGGQTFTATIATASTVWNVTHNLNTLNPKVLLKDTNNVEVEGDITVLDLNTVRINWYFPVAGSITVSN